MKALDVIKRDERAVAIFTRGGRFVHKPDGSGSTGNWVISASPKVDKVIIYKQDLTRGQHEIWVGSLVDVIDSEEEGRREVKMANLKSVGTTDHNWNEFTETKRGAVNPVKYIKHK